MLISKRVYDPSYPFPNNRLGRTTGFYGHLPKFWYCSEYDFDSGWKRFSHDGGKPEWWDEHAEESKAGHANCRRRGRHLSYPGYLRYIGKRRVYTFWYMGNPYRHKLFEVSPRQRIIT